MNSPAWIRGYCAYWEMVDENPYPESDLRYNFWNEGHNRACDEEEEEEYDFELGDEDDCDA